MLCDATQQPDKSGFLSRSIKLHTCKVESTHVLHSHSFKLSAAEWMNEPFSFPFRTWFLLVCWLLVFQQPNKRTFILIYVRAVQNCCNNGGSLGETNNSKMRILSVFLLFYPAINFYLSEPQVTIECGNLMQFLEAVITCLILFKLFKNSCFMVQVFVKNGCTWLPEICFVFHAYFML